jgi:glycolate oxidase
VGGIVLSVLGMKSIKEIDVREGIAVVEPGVVLGDLHDAVEQHGWFYPPDPNSLATCALGGNVAENAGGPRAFKYGVTREYVIGLEAFLIGGQRIFSGRRTLKGVTGYDVTALLVGSEGTPPCSATSRCLIPAARGISADDAFVSVREAALVQASLPLASPLHRDARWRDAGAMRSAGNPIDPRAGAMLLMDVDGDERQCELQSERIADACHAAFEVLVAQDAAQRERLWSARREMSLAVRRLARFKLAEDIVVPRQRIPDLLDRVARSSEQLAVRTLTYGHAGDGNLHVNFLWDDAEELPRVEKAIEQLFRDTIALSGTLSGEHAWSAQALYRRRAVAELIALERHQARVRSARIAQPGKIFRRWPHR